MYVATLYSKKRNWAHTHVCMCVCVYIYSVVQIHKNTVRIKVNKVMKIVDAHDEY